MSRNRTILLVEDNQDDVDACVAGLTTDSRLANPITHCRTGDEALDYLLGRGRFRHPRPERPCLILLDLNMPGTDGHDILAEIKGNPDLRTIPVVVMTSSRDPTDIAACYRAGANSYVAKPVNLAGFMEAIGRLREYWFEIVLLPDPA